MVELRPLETGCGLPRSNEASHRLLGEGTRQTIYQAEIVRLST